MTTTSNHAPSTVLPAVEQLFHTARSARAWSDRPVDDQLVQRVYDTVRWGPTLMNTSPLRLLLVRSAQARERLATHMAEGNRERVVTSPLAIVVAADAAFHDHLDALVPHLPGARDHFADDETRTRIAREQAWLQSGYLTVGLRAEGLDVGPMSGMDAAGIDADLLAGTEWRSLMVLNVGYPTPEGTAHPRAPRLAYDTVTRVA